MASEPEWPQKTVEKCFQEEEPKAEKD